MRYSIYRLSDGMIVDLKESDESHVAQNVPSGCGYIDWHHDHLSVRVNLETKQLIDYRPPQPSHEHEWHAETKRWRLTEAASVSIAADSSARKELDAIDRRAMRYLLEERDGSIDGEGKRRLAELIARKAELRKQLRPQQTR